MKILHDLDELAQHNPPDQKLVLTIGAYDGVHIAHRALIAGVVMRARELGGRAVVITFDPHPDLVLRPQSQLVLLTDLTDKTALISELSVDFLVIQPFTPDFTKLSPETFVEKLLGGGDVCEVHLGEDFRFGYKAQGTVERLREEGQARGFQVRTLASLEVDGQLVSSTAIRKLIAEGNVAQANRWLARAHSLKGVIVQGFQRGRILGFPTANMAVSTQFAVPSNGVYATVTTILSENVSRHSVTNIGVRPTFDNGVRSVETFIFDFDQDIYGQTIRVEFIQKLRDEQKFAGLDAIKAQLAQDVIQARAALGTAGR